ncbi:protein STRUBBELIG-RECEPTOR FAMILY 3-like isoform X2 [Malania oleifera]|uniref:protein STRUBBELIG-RECEPTOR FAMILY 3-like isoform X2 n=1 Tax=Malania oleifera TaxID=397392 RepID=UPI0025AE31A9|nr:protein STRUBBELIG-RECEPTOR FAMILY 3-like isoform X2 [Malania oleifera]
MGCSNRGICARLLMGLMVVSSAAMCLGNTDPRDVVAINSLFDAVGRPPLRGWTLSGGDPCAENWEGVECVFSNVTGIVLPGANLSGQLSDNLNSFASLMTLDLSNNHIGGSIPSNLPATAQQIFLSGNQFNGTIPSMITSLTQLKDMSLNNNHLSEGIPDVFQQLTDLINLDLSGNNLSGQLPQSLQDLSSLTTLHLQDNQFTGMLDVLQNLPLTDLNIENNLFWGPVPVKLFSIPNFRKDGNPFNTTVIPSPPALAPPPATAPTSPAPSSSLTPSPEQWHQGRQPNRPSAPETSSSATAWRFLTTKRIVWVSIGGTFIILVIAVVSLFLISRCCRRRQVANKIAKKHDISANIGPKPAFNDCMLQLNGQFEKAVPREVVVKSSLPPRPPPPLHPVEEVKPTETTCVRHTIEDTNCASSLSSFTIALLQQCTNSFSQKNFIGQGMIGSVYRAELPNGKLLAVKKLNAAASRWQTNDEFLQLVYSISKLKNANLVELVGYCADHGQRLLVYEYCRNGTLYDALHLDEEIHMKLSWNARICIALGAARALEYLHEVCQPPNVHRNFKSANILLDDKLAVCVSDCGLAPLVPSGSGNELSGDPSSAYGYGAPESELGSYTHQSDIYSFGIVMLELLTGRKSYDRSRPWGEQFLVRWAIPQLHDINALSRMVDPTLNGAYPSKSLSRFADIISLCVQLEPEFRPPMSEIVQDLSHMIEREG